MAVNLDKLPPEIKVDESFAKKRAGRPTTVSVRRNSEPVRGKVKGKRNFFTEKEKINACCVFAVTGNSRRTAEITKIPEATIRTWKTTEWWNEVHSRIINEQDQELDVKLTKLVDKAVDAVNDRLEHGDYVYNPREDKLVRKPVNAKDLAIVTAITVDKRQLLRGQPTARVEKVSTDETLNRLAKQFQQFALAKEVHQEPELITEGEILDGERP